MIEQKTAVRIRDIPCGFCTSSIKPKIDDTGYPGKYSGTYDFVHLPKNVDENRTGRSMGYGFINFRNASVAREFLKEWSEYYKTTKISENSPKEPSADWATRRHGFDANLRHHQNQDPDWATRRHGFDANLQHHQNQDLSKVGNPDDKPQFFQNGAWCVLVDNVLVPISSLKEEQTMGKEEGRAGGEDRGKDAGKCERKSPDKKRRNFPRKAQTRSG